MKKFHLEEAFSERAQMSTEQLKALGYTDEEAALLKAYDGSTINENSAVVAAAATCTGGYYLKSASASEMNFRYKWEWSSLPMFQGKDKVAVYWEAYNSKSQEIDVDSKHKKHIKYYRMSDGKFMYDQDKAIGLRQNSGFNGTVASVVMSKENGGDTVGNSYVWAKKGYVRVVLTKNQANMKYIKFSGAYGHMIAFVEPSISVSGSLSISFSPKSGVETLARKNYKITSDGSVTRL